MNSTPNILHNIYEQLSITSFSKSSSILQYLSQQYKLLTDIIVCTHSSGRDGALSVSLLKSSDETAGQPSLNSKFLLRIYSPPV
ncbi:hypothetical protein OIU77_008490 [Salix suchowensis]|uniref:Uncharacterized protein n=1 Tax=Salix suchowensis TaxID=1278906 RepID=A0ABQ9AKS8_9ROSI|nr:hypothetical protein OIU77_008490 [Salix suchowensis]